MKKIVMGLLVLSLMVPVVQAGDVGVNHVVLCWLKNKDAESMKKFIAAVDGLTSIPTVESVSVGKMVKSEEPVADNSFDVGFVITFKSKDGLDAYLVHPDHVKAVTDVLKPALEKVVVYDFEK